MPQPVVASSIARSSGDNPGAEFPLVEELTPLPDAWQLFQRIAGLPHALFLDSALRPAPAAANQSLGRYSSLTADPFETITARGACIHITGQAAAKYSGNPFKVFADRLERFRTQSILGLPPFQGGAAGLFGYDLGRHLEELPPAPRGDFQVPDLAIGLYDWTIAFDHALGRAWLISTGFPEQEPRRRLRRAKERMRSVKQRLSRDVAGPKQFAAPPLPCPEPSFSVPGIPRLVSNFDRAGYLRAVNRVIKYIEAGDCFQVNLAQRLLYPTTAPAIELYGRLRTRNPAPFAAYFNLGDFAILSASPERFLRVENGIVETRPIKGTRRRGETAEQDQATAAELLGSEKDRAENIMIVDLLRNDLGRVCAFGSIEVPAVCRLESFRHVHHLVSEVRGRLREDASAVDLLCAAFPGGSVTGAPKIRAMEIITELEPSARGAYCGSLGYVGFDGSMDMNILIRTMTQGRGWVQFAVGGGIVAESDPEREYEETWHKARGLIDALRDA